jgi:hypothetical protein
VGAHHWPADIARSVVENSVQRLARLSPTIPTVAVRLLAPDRCAREWSVVCPRHVARRRQVALYTDVHVDMMRGRSRGRERVSSLNLSAREGVRCSTCQAEPDHSTHRRYPARFGRQMLYHVKRGLLERLRAGSIVEGVGLSESLRPSP